MRLIRRVLPAWLTSVGISLGVPLWAVWANRASGSYLDHFSNWDAAWFLQIARHGYPARLDPTDAFLPGYPLLINLAGRVAHQPVVAGVAISVMAGLVALIYLYRLVEMESSREVATIAVWLVAVFPTALFMSAVYSDACFMASAAAALFYARRGNAWRAATATMIGGSFRVFAVALLAALAWELWRHRAPALAWASLAVAPLSLIAFGAYLYLHAGDALAFLHAEGSIAFGAHLVWPWQGAGRSWSIALYDPSMERRRVYVVAILYSALAVGAVIVAWASRLPRSLAAYATVVVLLTISVSTWRSAGRYDLALFPLALLAGPVAVRWPSLQRVGIGVGGVGLSLSALAWASGAWVG